MPCSLLFFATTPPPTQLPPPTAPSSINCQEERKGRYPDIPLLVQAQRMRGGPGRQCHHLSPLVEPQNKQGYSPAEPITPSISLLMGLSTGCCNSCWWTSEAPRTWWAAAGPESSSLNPALLNSQLQRYYIPLIEPLTWNLVKGWKLFWGAARHIHLLCSLNPS